MKKIIFLLVLVTFIAACNSEPRYVIKGNIEDSDSITFLLVRRVDGNITVTDSAVSKKGSFKLSGSVDYPEQVQLIAKNTNYRTSLWLENSKISVTGSLDSLFDATITGSITQDEYQALIASNRTLRDQYTSLYMEYQEARRANDAAKIASLEESIEKISDDMNLLQKNFIRDNPASYITPSVIQGLSYQMESSDIEAAINALDPEVAKVPAIQDLKARVDMMKSVAIGQKAPDFTMNDVDGNPVSLYSRVGTKLLLVDFWAAWCNPCRIENPNVVNVYKTFNKKGFDVFGVSLDRSKEDWVKAIADDKLTWTHVSDLLYWNNAAAKQYAVNSIPANFLLDENGIIIAKNLREQALYDKVNEILNQK